MVDLLKQVMLRYLKQDVVKEKAVDELFKLDTKNVELQLKDEDLDIGKETRKPISDLKQSGNKDSVFLVLDLST